MRYTVHVDDGHEWLEAPRAVARDAGILDRISRYSHQSPDGRILYLEGDCDAALLINALGLTDFRETYTQGDSAIRRLPSFAADALA